MFTNSKLFMKLIKGVVILAMVGIFYWLPIAGNAQASVWDKKEVTVYRSPSCSCCGNWIKHMENHGFKIAYDLKTENMEAIKQHFNVPQQLESCHTAIIDNYVMEGHVPADDIKRFIAQSPKQTGLSVPGMPWGTPGMEMGNKKQPFDVVSFDRDRQIKVFQEYRSY